MLHSTTPKKGLRLGMLFFQNELQLSRFYDQHGSIETMLYLYDERGKSVGYFVTTRDGSQWEEYHDPNDNRYYLVPFNDATKARKHFGKPAYIVGNAVPLQDENSTTEAVTSKRLQSSRSVRVAILRSAERLGVKRFAHGDSAELQELYKRLQGIATLVGVKQRELEGAYWANTTLRDDQNLKHFVFHAPPKVFELLRIEALPMWADIEKIRQKRDKNRLETEGNTLDTNEKIIEHIQYVLDDVGGAFPASKRDSKVLYRIDALGKIVVLEIVKRGNKYRIVTAHEASIEKLLKKEKNANRKFANTSKSGDHLADESDSFRAAGVPHSTHSVSILHKSIESFLENQDHISMKTNSLQDRTQAMPLAPRLQNTVPLQDDEPENNAATSQRLVSVRDLQIRILKCAQRLGLSEYNFGYSEERTKLIKRVRGIGELAGLKPPELDDAHYSEMGGEKPTIKEQPKLATDDTSNNFFGSISNPTVHAYLTRAYKEAISGRIVKGSAVFNSFLLMGDYNRPLRKLIYTELTGRSATNENSGITKLEILISDWLWEHTDLPKRYAEQVEKEKQEEENKKQELQKAKADQSFSAEQLYQMGLFFDPSDYPADIVEQYTSRKIHKGVIVKYTPRGSDKPMYGVVINCSVMTMTAVFGGTKQHTPDVRILYRDDAKNPYSARRGGYNEVFFNVKEFEHVFTPPLPPPLPMPKNKDQIRQGFLERLQKQYSEELRQQESAVKDAIAKRKPRNQKQAERVMLETVNKLAILSRGNIPGEPHVTDYRNVLLYESIMQLFSEMQPERYAEVSKAIELSLQPRQAPPKPEPVTVPAPTPLPQSNTPQRQYFDVVETAKLIRRDLAEAFPGQKFKVTSEKFSGGDSIHVSYFDGPTEKAVNNLIQKYKNSDFDGMTDMSSSRAMGFKIKNLEGKDVLFDGGSKFVSTSRKFSRQVVEKYIAQFDRKDECIIELKGSDEYGWGANIKPKDVRTWDDWIERDFQNNLHNSDFYIPPATTQSASTTATPRSTTPPSNTEIRHNTKMNGIEIVFPAKPDQGVIDMLKRQGFRWSSRGGLWYCKYTSTLLEKMKAYFGIEQVTTLNDYFDYEGLGDFFGFSDSELEPLLQRAADKAVQKGILSRFKSRLESIATLAGLNLTFKAETKDSASSLSPHEKYLDELEKTVEYITKKIQKANATKDKIYWDLLKRELEEDTPPQPLPLREYQHVAEKLVSLMLTINKHKKLDFRDFIDFKQSYADYFTILPPNFISLSPVRRRTISPLSLENTDLLALFDPFRGQDSYRPMMMCLYVDDTNITATDGYRMIVLQHNGAIRKRGMFMYDKGTKNKSVFPVTENTPLPDDPKATFGRYVDFLSVIPRAYDHKGTLRIAEMRRICESLRKNYGRTSSDPTRFSIRHLITQKDNPAQYDEITFNASYMEDALIAFESLGITEIDMEATTQNKGTIIRPASGQPYRSELFVLLMPLRGPIDIADSDAPTAFY